MVRSRLVAIVMIALVVIVLPPGISYVTQADDDMMLVDYTVTAYAPADRAGATFTIEYTFSVNESIGMVDYIGVWWGGVLGLGESASPPSYPCVQVLTQLNYDTDTRWVGYWAYELGDRFEYSGSFYASPGDTAVIQVQVYYAQSVASHSSESFTVP